MELSAGDRVDRFVLVSQLGEGGQGAVWKAEDPLSPGEPRALKLVAVNPARPNDVERVRREARALARLSHASLVQCHGLFEDLKRGVVGVVMDFVDGQSLRDADRNPRFGPPHRIAVLKHVARVLAYLHASGVVHRDLKLDNVLVKSAFFAEPDQPGNVKVVDLGIASQKDVPGRLTVQGTVIGTMSYLAPELLDPATFSADESAPAIDVFAFGVLGWQLLTGDHPTGLPSGATLVDYVRAYRHASTLDEWPPAAPDGEWGALLCDALAVAQDRRIPSGAELVVRTEIAPGGAVVVRPGIDPAAQPEFAPTSVATPGAMRDPTQASSRAVARSVAPMPTAPAAAGPPPSQSGWLWGALGIVAVGAVGGMLWMLFGPRDNQKALPLSAVPSASATSGPTSKTATPLVPTAADDAGMDATATDAASSVALPEGCDPATAACDCCPSGLECAAGKCTQLIAPNEGFHLRLAEVPLNGDKPLSSTHPSAEVCVKIADVARWTCLPISELADGTATSHAYATMVDLTEKGIDVQIRFELSPNVHAPLASAERVIFPGAMRALVCKGLEIETQSRNIGIEKLRLYLDPDDSQAAVPERKECP